MVALNFSLCRDGIGVGAEKLTKSGLERLQVCMCILMEGWWITETVS